MNTHRLCLRQSILLHDRNRCRVFYHDMVLQVEQIGCLSKKFHSTDLFQITQMRHTLALILLGFGYVLPTVGQSVSVNASITLTSPKPTCSFTRDSHLSFGSVEKPGGGTGSVIINAQTGTRTVSGVSESGSIAVGQLRLTGSNVANYSVSRSFPSTLTKSTDQLTFSGAWSQSSSAGSGYSSISGASYSGAAGGSSFTRYFRFGGTVSGIDSSDPSGTYTGTITATATCS